MVGDGPPATVSGTSDEDVPAGPPRHFYIVAESSTSMNVNWSAPATPNGVITEYQLQCSGGEQVFNRTVMETTITLSGLLPYTNYSCSITAHTSVGGGPAVTTSVTTLEDVPSGPPQNFTISVTSRSAAFSWFPPLLSQRNGVIIGYNLTCTVDGMSRSMRLSVTSQNVTAVPFTSYSCTVSAATDIGDGPATVVISGVTDEEKPGTPPRDLDRVSNDPRSLTLTWKAPVQPNGVITEYQLQCSGGGQVFNRTVMDTTTTLSGLLPYTNYSCSITAHTMVGGGPAATTSVTTLQDVPMDSVRNLTVISVLGSSTILNISWFPPATPNGVITDYEVNVSTSASIDIRNFTASEDFLANTRFSRNIINLIPGVPYYVKVTAYTIKGRGPYSDEVINFTEQGVPSQGPEITDITRLTDGSIIVMWKLLTLEEARGFIIGYTVTAQQADFGLVLRQTPNTMRVSPKDSMATIHGLDPKHAYTITLSANTSQGDNSSSTLLQPSEKLFSHLVVSGSGILGFVIVAVLILITCVLMVCIVTRYKRRKISGVHLKVELSKYRVKDDSDETIELKIIQTDHDTDGEDKASRTIPVKQFPAYVKLLHSDRDSSFEDHFQAINKLPKGSCVIAKKQSNVPKNRFENICSYDHSCVELSLIDDKEGTDYINASWMDNFRKTRAYIASQGPLDSTIGDFWRMVWQYNIPAVVMLTNLVERTVKKCSCYWPEEIDQPMDVGYGISVTLVEEHILAEYKIKELLITNTSEEDCKPRRVFHYHFTQWPDHGVPASKLCLISFIKRVRKQHPPEGPPLVVHCSAGVGRTGTFIVLDTMLQRMEVEGDLKVYDFVTQLRKRRTLMVQNMAQYIYIHDALSEYITCGDTSFPLMNAHVTLRELSNVDENDKSGFQRQFELLEELSEPPEGADTSEATANMSKNRYTYNLPYNSTRVWLNSGQTDYINASRIHGYKRRGAFLATQAPMKETVEDFWHMIWETQSKAIVMLCNLEEEGKETCYQYWPTKAEGTAVYGNMTVKLLQEASELDGLIVRKLEIIQEGDYINVASAAGKFEVTQFHYQRWPENMKPFPSDVVDLLNSLIKAQVAAGNKPITVMCNDGVGRTGAFICIYSQLEKVKMEGMGDIFQFIKDSRLQRKGLVRHQDHYIFCYEVIADFSDTMGVYDNFRNVM